MNKLKLLLLIGTLIGLLPVAASNPIIDPVSRQFGNKISINSKVLGEERSVIIHLPSGYEKTEKRYPVLYLLDGERHLYHSVVASELLLKAKQVPELIIVAITNSEGMRQRNLNTESESFTLFLSRELITFVDNNYRTTDSNTLFGHSLAGFYTVNLLANTPGVFVNYIAASPPLDGDDIELYNKIVAPNNVNEIRKKKLYFTLGSKTEEGEDITNAMNNFVKLLGESSPQGFDWHYEFLDGDTHITTPYLTLFEGIRYVFKK